MNKDRESLKPDKASIIMSEEEEFTMQSAECYVLLEKYKLKTNVIGINLEKQIYQNYYNSLQARMTERYTYIYDQLQAALKNLNKHFVIAQANSLRTLNNIIRNYRRRVGLFSNEPLSNFKYNKHEKNEKMLLESMIYNQRENFENIRQFKSQLAHCIELGDKEINEKYKKNDKIKENHQNIFDLIDKTECYTHKYYDNFERSMLTTIPSLQAHFQKLNGYLSVWENIASTKAYQIKSSKEIQNQEKAHSHEKPVRFFQEESEEQLEELLSNCPMHSPQREEYRRRLNDLRRYNNDKMKKLEMVGKMFNKRRNRTGILLNKSKDIGVLEWIIDLDNAKVPHRHYDQFKIYNGENDQNEFRLTNYQLQKPFKKAEDIKLHMQKFKSSGPLTFQWWYDRFGKDGAFNLINSSSNQVQKRIEFEVIRQTELQNSDDRRKRELLEKQTYVMKENERRQSLHIGYKHVHDKTQLQWLTSRSYATEYIPEMYPEEEASNISFSDDSDSEKQEDFSAVKKTTKQRKVVEKVEKTIITEQIPFIQIKNEIIQPKQEACFVKEVKEETYNTLQQQIIHSFYKEYSLKILRKDDEAESKKTIFLYFSQISNIEWLQIPKYLQNQKIFIMTKESIVYFHKIISVKHEKVKCVIFTLEQEIDEESIKANISESFFKIALVTVKIQPIYTQLEPQDTSPFMLGLLSVLNREGEMPEDYENKNYISEGKEIIEDFNFYFYPQENQLTKNSFMKKVTVNKFKEVFKPLKKQEDDKIEKQAVKSTSIEMSTASYDKKSKSRPSPQLSLTNSLVKETESIKIAEPPMSYQLQQQRHQMKKSNSRQFLKSSDLQIELGKLDLGQKDEEEHEEDYEAL